MLLSTMPSGDERIVSARQRLFCSAYNVCRPHSAPGHVPSCMHVSSPFHRYSSSLLYVGDGSSDCQSRPSAWFNPYAFVVSEPLEAVRLFRQYLESRADLAAFLSHCGGKTLVCDCSFGPDCHARVLVEMYVQVFGDAIASAEVSDHDGLDAMDEACVLEGFDEDDSGPDDLAPAPSFRPDIESINETCRTGAARLSEERPGWLPSWLRLIQVIRGARTPVFWEIFSGKAGLTREFLRQGWPCGPPVDILYNTDFDVLNPLFLCVVLGLIFEHLIAMLHLGPPCASFSMAVNRFVTYAMRSSASPAGLPDLPPHREEKVRLGNALAVVAVRLAEAQQRAGGLWTFEQPASSLMLLYDPVAKLFANEYVVMVVTHVCSFGAPWKKPTMLAANFPEIRGVVRRCSCTKPHLTLQCNSPLGNHGLPWPALTGPSSLSAGWRAPARTCLIPLLLAARRRISQALRPSPMTGRLTRC